VTFAIADHVLVALMVLMDPWLAIWAYRRMTASLAAGDAKARIRSYRRAIVLELTGAAVILVLWAVYGRPLERLVTLTWLPEGWWTVLAWAVVLLACALLIAQLVAIRGNEAELSNVRKQMTSVKALLPHTPVELKLFLGMSLAAGVGEEIVFRGYLLSYFDAFVGPAGAVLASTVIFGLGHAYQGAAGIVKTAAAGLLCAAAFVGTGSLLAPMLLHAVTDAVSGVAAYLVLKPETTAGGLRA
jgi:uncharacterized protein